MWEGKREQTLGHLRSRRPSHGEAPAALEDAVQDRENQRDGIGDSQMWEEQGYPVGSG